MQFFKPTLTAIGLLMTLAVVRGQDKRQITPIQTISEKELHLSPFSKGNWEFRIDRKIDYEYMNNYIEDDKQGHESGLSVDMQAIYYFINGFGAGLEFCGDWSGEHNGTDYLTRTWMAFGHLTYGRPLTDDIGLYGRIGAGFGRLTDITKLPNTTVKDKHDLFGIKAEMGVPMPLNTGFSYITPYLNYHFTSTDYDNSKEKESSFGIGLRLTTFLGCSDMTCDCHKKRQLASGRYSEGSSFIDYTTNGHFRFGTTKFDYDNMGSDNKDKFSRGSIRLHYSYYIIDNLAIGAGLRFNNSTNKEDDSGDKTTQTMWSIMPVIEYNLPFKNALNNLFVQGAVGYGNDRFKQEENNEPEEIAKYRLFNFGVGVGYNDFFANRLSVTPYVGYEWNIRRQKDTAIRYRNQGFEFGLGIRTFF